MRGRGERSEAMPQQAEGDEMGVGSCLFFTVTVREGDGDYVSGAPPPAALHPPDIKRTSNAPSHRLMLSLRHGQGHFPTR